MNKDLSVKDSKNMCISEFTKDIHRAMITNNSKKLEELLSNQNLTKTQKQPFLNQIACFAAEHGRSTMLNLVLLLGADPAYDNNKPLRAAIRALNTEISKQKISRCYLEPALILMKDLRVDINLDDNMLLAVATLNDHQEVIDAYYQELELRQIEFIAERALLFSDKARSNDFDTEISTTAPVSSAPSRALSRSPSESYINTKEFQKLKL